MFNLGDKVAYPMHGAGIIVSKEEKKILGEKKVYYILQMPISDLKISVPADRIEEIGIREVVDINQLVEVEEILNQKEIETEPNWNKRYKANLARLKSGNIIEITKVYRDLYILDAIKNLSMVEKKLFNISKKMLVSEVAIVTEKDAHTVEKVFERELKKMIDNHS